MAKWKPGQSGNPAGKRKGLPDRRRVLREKIESHADELIALAVEMARSGDAAALSMLLARAVAPLRPAADPVAFDMPTDASLADQARAILGAIAEGKLDPVTGRALVDAIASVGRVIETEELEARIRALEEGNAT